MTTDPIKAKIQELCPDVMDWKYVEGPGGSLGGEKAQVKDITLAVVLRAINQLMGDWVAVSTEGRFWTQKGSEPIHLVDIPFLQWKLHDDNYDVQSEECKQFIGNLLGV